jgi:nucleoside-diphosphate-sugar epimerase
MPAEPTNREGQFMPAVLVTGGSGFLGRHVLAELERAGFGASDIIAVGRRPPAGWPADSFLAVDLLAEPYRLGSIVRARRPALILHLAGRTPPAASEELENGNARLLDVVAGAIEEAPDSCRLVLAGSAAEYGDVPAGRLPVRESEPCRPIDAYGRGKSAATQRAMALRDRTGAAVVVGRVFNLSGPGLPQSQAFGRFAAELARQPGPMASLRVGCLEARRDFVDVRDAARALVILAQKGRSGEVYNIASAVSHSIGEGLDRLVRLSGKQVDIRRDPERTAHRGVIESRGSIDKIQTETGWSPAITFEQSLADLWTDASRPRACPGEPG